MDTTKKRSFVPFLAQWFLSYATVRCRLRVTRQFVCGMRKKDLNSGSSKLYNEARTDRALKFSERKAPFTQRPIHLHTRAHTQRDRSWGGLCREGHKVEFMWSRWILITPDSFEQRQNSTILWVQLSFGCRRSKASWNKVESVENFERHDSLCWTTETFTTPVAQKSTCSLVSGAVHC